MKRVVSLYVFLCLAVVLCAQERKQLRYRGVVDVESGIAYNLNTAQTISTNNMQLYSSITTTHGVQLRQYYVGVGLGYYHSFRDKENIYSMFCAFSYDWENVILSPFVDLRLGVAYDPYWISPVQTYGTMSIGIKLYKNFHVGCRGTIFSRPSRYFTANAAFVLGYVF